MKKVKCPQCHVVLRVLYEGGAPSFHLPEDFTGRCPNARAGGERPRVRDCPTLVKAIEDGLLVKIEP